MMETRHVRVDPIPDRSANNLGIIRLVLAALVVVSHAAEGVDGNRSRELLTSIFGTLSFGEFAVDGFFLVSGYLITRSFMTSTSTANYLLKRVLRIYPGFVVAYLVCVIALAPAVGGDLAHSSATDVMMHVGRLLLLKEPTVASAFAGLPYPALNGSMWTIAYEFRCYLLVPLLAAIGLLRQRHLLAVVIALLLIMMVANVDVQIPKSTVFMTGTFRMNIRFAAIFGCGMLFCLYQDRIIYRGWLALVAGVIFVCLSFSPMFAEAALALAGGYVLFWFAFHVKLGRLARMTSKDDVSYGLYLYAWPVQNLVIWTIPDVSPLVVFLITLPVSVFLGFVSWKLIEQPFLRFKPPAPVIQASARPSLTGE